MPILLTHALALATLVSPPRSDLRRFEIDPGHSHIGFAVRHLVVSTVKGRFDSIAGSIFYDAENPLRSSVSVRIQSASVNSGNPRRDADVRAGQLLDVARYPEITFHSTAIRRNGQQWIADGSLTIHGVTRPVSIPFTFAGPIDRGPSTSTIGVEGELIINRRDFGITFSGALPDGGLVVANEVSIELQLEAHQTKAR